MAPHAYLFDFGGVITTSPFDNFARYEREHGLPVDFIRKVNSTDPDANAWAQLERSGVTPEEFDALFRAESAALGHPIPGADVLACLSTELRPRMVRAVEVLAANHPTALLTNNFLSGGHADESADQPQDASGKGSAGESSGVRFNQSVLSLFDVVVESAVVGVRKPEPSFYEIACEQLDVEPEQCVFLDDLGINLKPARAMGMTTIKVTDEQSALDELTALSGLDLT